MSAPPGSSARGAGRLADRRIDPYQHTAGKLNFDAAAFSCRTVRDLLWLRRNLVPRE
jgi:hypothetical protein